MLDDARTLWTVGVCLYLLAREFARGGGHTYKSMDMGGGPWKNRRTLVWLIYTSVTVS